jgi:hypothetical protein
MKHFSCATFLDAIAEVRKSRLTVDRWRQIYHLSKASRDFKAFAAHLEATKIASDLSPPSTTSATPPSPPQSASSSDNRKASIASSREQQTDAPGILKAEQADAPQQEAAGRQEQAHGSSIFEVGRGNWREIAISALNTSVGMVTASSGAPAMAMRKADRLGDADDSSDPQNPPPKSLGTPHPTLTKEWARQHSRENLVIVTWCNYHFLDFVENWIAHLTNHRELPQPFFVCMRSDAAIDVI